MELTHDDVAAIDGYLRHACAATMKAKLLLPWDLAQIVGLAEDALYVAGQQAQERLDAQQEGTTDGTE